MFKQIPGVGLLLRLIQTNVRMQNMSAEEKNKLKHEYHAQLGLGSGFTLGADAFDNYMKNKSKDYRVLKTTIDTTGKEGSVFTKLSEPDNEQVRGGISVALSDMEKQFEQAQNNYNLNMQAAKKFIDGIPAQYHAGDIIAFMKNATDEAIRAIETGQKNELNKFKTVLQNSTIPEKERPSLSQSLQDAHKKQLDEFKKSAEETLNTLHVAAAQEREHFYFIAMLHKNNKEMRATIEQLARQNTRNTPKSATISQTPDSITLSGVRIQDLGVIKSITGRKITAKDGVFTVEMPWFSKHTYYNPRHENPLVDFTLMAQAVRACGHDHITFELDGFSQQNQSIRAQQAYEACINSGYPPEKITIKIDGKERKPEEIFNNNPAKLAQLNSNSIKIQKQFNDLYGKGSNSTLKKQEEMKGVVEKLRTEQVTDSAYKTAVQDPLPPMLRQSDNVPLSPK